MFQSTPFFLFCMKLDRSSKVLSYKLYYNYTYSSAKRNETHENSTGWFLYKLQ